MRPGSQVGPWDGGAPPAGLCPGLDAAGTAGWGRSHCCHGQGWSGVGGPRVSCPSGGRGRGVARQALPPSRAGADYLGAGTQVVSGHFRSPGALPTDLPCHGRHLRHRGCPGQASTTQTGGTWAAPRGPQLPLPSTSHTLDLTECLTLDWGSLPGSHTQEAGPKGAPSLPGIGVGGRGPRPLRGRRTPSTPSSLEEGLPPTEPKVGRGCLTQKPLAYKHPQLTAPPQDQTGQARPQAPLLAASPGKTPRTRRGPSRLCPARPSPACRPRRSPASCRHLGKPRPGDPPSVAPAPSRCGLRAGSGRSPAFLAAPFPCTALR